MRSWSEARRSPRRPRVLQADAHSTPFPQVGRVGRAEHTRQDHRARAETLAERFQDSEHLGVQSRWRRRGRAMEARTISTGRRRSVFTSAKKPEVFAGTARISSVARAAGESR
jgi:hypothetical protein